MIYPQHYYSKSDECINKYDADEFTHCGCPQCAIATETIFINRCTIRIHRYRNFSSRMVFIVEFDDRIFTTNES